MPEATRSLSDGELEPVTSNRDRSSPPSLVHHVRNEQNSSPTNTNISTSREALPGCTTKRSAPASLTIASRRVTPFSSLGGTSCRFRTNSNLDHASRALLTACTSSGVPLCGVKLIPFLPSKTFTRSSVEPSSTETCTAVAAFFIDEYVNLRFNAFCKRDYWKRIPRKNGIGNWSKGHQITSKNCR